MCQITTDTNRARQPIW